MPMPMRYAVNGLRRSLSVDIVLGDYRDATPNEDVPDGFKVQVRIGQRYC